MPNHKTRTRDLFRVTVDEPNYSSVLGTPLNEDQKNHLSHKLKIDGDLRIWAINETSPAANTYHNYMTSGDGLLFYKVVRGLASDEKMYVGVGFVDEMFEVNSDLAVELFQTASARLMFTVDDFIQIAKTVDDVEPVLGYKQHPRKTQRVIPARYQTVESVFSQLQR